LNNVFFDFTKVCEISENNLNIGSDTEMHLKQSFMTAGKAFKAIDAPTHAVIVPYGHGQCLITKLRDTPKKFDAKRYYDCLKQAQKYSVNVFPNVWKILYEQQAIHEIQGEGVYYLDERYYSPEFGLSTEPVGKEEAIIL
jgi:CRISPR-associated endonuclease/helicase Cas3